MKKLLAGIFLATLVTGPALADSFGIDFSPLHEPGFGKRRDYGVDPPAGNSSGGTARPDRPAGPSDAMKRLGRELEASQARLSRAIIAIPEVAVPEAGYYKRTAELDIGDTMFNVRKGDVATFGLVPDDFHPALGSGRGLPIAAQIIGFAASEDLSCGDADAVNTGDLRVLTCEDASFLAGQAAMALAGEPLRVSIEDTLEVSAKDRATVGQAINEWNAARNAFEIARVERLSAERATLADPVNILKYDGEEREREKDAKAARYTQAIESQRLAGERLFTAQRELREAMKRAGGG